MLAADTKMAEANIAVWVFIESSQILDRDIAGISR
jgi:hypothetical protein